MNRFTRSISLALCASLLLISANMTRLHSVAVPPQPARAPQPQLGGSCFPPLIPCGLLPALPVIPTLPLGHVTIPDRSGQSNAGQPLVRSPNQGVAYRLGPQAASLNQQSCSSTNEKLKVLIITADPTDTNTALPAIEQALNFQGTPYTVSTATPRPSDATTNRLASLLSSGCSANFDGVILGNGQVAYTDPTAGWESALTDPEWQSLYAFEAAFNIRQVSWYTFPDANYGFNAPNSSGDTTTSPISLTYTGAGQPVYSYANTAGTLTIQNAWAYKATPLDSNTSSLLTDSSGDALVAIKTYPNGTQNLAMTFDGNPNLTHTVVLAYGAINWVTNGLFLGQRHAFAVPQEDDIFIDDHIWAEGTACGTDPETTPVTYRITGADLQSFVNWQSAVQSHPSTGNFVLTNAFVGEGTNGEYSPDTLTPKAQALQGSFYWVNHTYNHENLNNTSYNETASQISQNVAVAQQMGFTNFSTKNIITPDISGLSNPNAMQAIHDAGILYMVSDTSQPGQNNPSPNIGIYNQYQPSVLEIPRLPNNLFYNVSNPEQWIEEYNCFYASYWGRNLTYPEVLDKESDVLLHYILEGNMDPWMFHQPNMRAYDGTHSLLGDLMDSVFTKYNALYSLPIVDPTQDNLGAQMAQRMAYSSAGVTASIVPGQSITITAQNAAVVPVTGLRTSGAESYGGQSISHVSLNAGQSVTLSLNGNPPTATPTNTPAATATATNTPLPTNTATPTSIIPTITVTVPLPTNTLLPPTGTNTPAPTNTSQPPTATPTTANQLPVAGDDSYSMHLSGVTLNVPAPGVLGNDSDADGDPLTAVLVSSTTHGQLTLNSDGSFTYVPTTSLLTFSDSFTYKAYDGHGYSNVATVTIQVSVP
jgi:VCBS repeat-containing protein